MLPWIFSILLSLKVSVCSCGPEVRRLGVARVQAQYRVEHLGRLPPVLRESSGLARRTADGRSVWTHNDGGNPAMLYGISVADPTLPGTLLDSISLPHLPNVDWEDLAQQDTARLFIADVGNNTNARQDLTIYPVRVQRGGATDTANARPIRLRYTDQKTFPPPPNQRNFDCEAVFYRSDSLFLLSKNRSGHQVRLYGLPARSTGSLRQPHRLAPLDSVHIRGMVTGAALSPAGRTLAVLTYGKILFFDLSASPATRLRHPTGCLRVPRGQTEAITFLTETTLLFTNERGHLYRLRPRP